MARYIYLYIIVWLEIVSARLINTTIYDTNLGHVTYEPQANFCAEWSNHWFWRTCDVWAQPWRSDVYYHDGRSMSVHRSIDHYRAYVAVEFEGSAVWLYGPPRAQLAAVPPDYKICVQERHSLASDETCYRVDIAEAYSAAQNHHEPVVIFAKGGLRRQAHRVVVSVGDPIDNTRAHVGIQFSHAVYTIERPTPWPVKEDTWRFRRVVMHDTHPLLTYHPAQHKLDCDSFWCWIIGQTGESGWTAKKYRAEAGARVSWHELRLSGEHFGSSQWGVEAIVTAGSVAVYGIPKAHITHASHLSQICVRIDSGRCDIVDVQHAYLNSRHENESVLLWRHDGLDPSKETHISVRLANAGEKGVFAFKSIEYYEPQEYANPAPLDRHSQNIEIAHDGRQIVYHPGRRCVNHFAWWCTKWFDPWVWREEGPTGSRLTYRSTVWAYKATEDPSIEVEFRGSAVYVYGAPKTFVKGSFASQHVCINEICHILDLEQAYLNAPADMKLRSYEPHIASSRHFSLNEQQKPETGANVTTLRAHPAYEPVLIWSITGLDDQVSHKLRLALASLASEENAEMSIAKVVYTKITYEPGESRPDPPVPQPDPRYEGPVYPPYARKWVPHHLPPAPSLPPSTPSFPHPSPALPTIPPRTHYYSSSSAGVVVLVVTSVIFSMALLVCCLCVMASNQPEERQPLIHNSYNHYSQSSRPAPIMSPPTTRNSPGPYAAPSKLNHGTNPTCSLATANRSASGPSNSPSFNHASTSILHPTRTNQQSTNHRISGFTRPILNQPNDASRRSEGNDIGPATSHNLTSTRPSSSCQPAPPSVISPPPSYTQPPSYAERDDSQTVTSTTSTVLPPYSQIVQETRVRQERAAQYVSRQRGYESQYQPVASALRREVVQDSYSVVSIEAPAQQRPPSRPPNRPVWITQPATNQISSRVPNNDSQQRTDPNTRNQSTVGSAGGHPRVENRVDVLPVRNVATARRDTRGGAVQSRPRNAAGTPGNNNGNNNVGRTDIPPAPGMNSRGGRRGRGGPQGNNSGGGRRYNNGSDDPINHHPSEHHTTNGEGSGGRGRHGGRGRRGREQGRRNGNGN